MIAALAGCEFQYGRNARSDFNEAYGPDKADNQVQPCTWMFISQRIRPDARIPEELFDKGLVEPNYGWIHKGDTEVNTRKAGAYRVQPIMASVGAAAGIAAAITARLHTDVRNVSIPELQNDIEKLNVPVDI